MRDFVATLPPELILQICCYLDPQSLEAFSGVCRKSNALIKDDSAWKNAFHYHFGNLRHFEGLERTWKAEFLKRHALVRKYQRGRGQSIVYDGRIGAITDVFLDATNGRLFVSNTANGLVSISNPETGKVSKGLVYPAATRLTSSDITTIHLSKTRVLYGTTSGNILVNQLNHQGHVTSFQTLSEWHAGVITAICGQDTSTDRNCAIEFITASLDGTVKLWNLQGPRQCLATIDITEHGVVKMSWDTHRQSLCMISLRQEVFVLDLSTFPAMSENILKLLYTPDAAPHSRETSWFDVLWDKEARSVIVTREDDVLIHSTDASCPATRNLHTNLQGRHCQIAIGHENSGRKTSLPGSGGRLFAIADDQGSIVVSDARSAGIPLRYIHLEDCVITTLCINSTVLAVGCHDGRVLLFNILDLTALRPLASRIAKYQHIAEHDPTRTAVHCITLLERHAGGIITTGGQIRAFDFDRDTNQTHGKRRGLTTKKTATQSTLTASSATFLQEIKQGLSDVRNAEALDHKQQKQFRKFTGSLGDEMTDDELMAYGQLLSLDADPTSSQSHTFEKDNDVPAELAHLSERSSDQSTNFQEDLDLALALSMSLA